MTLIVRRQLLNEVLGQPIAPLGHDGISLLAPLVGGSIDMTAANQEHLGIPQVFQQVQCDLQIEGHRRRGGEVAGDRSPCQVDDAVPGARQGRQGGGILQIHDQGLNLGGQVEVLASIQGHHLVAPTDQGLSHVTANETRGSR